MQACSAAQKRQRSCPLLVVPRRSTSCAKVLNLLCQGAQPLVPRRSTSAPNLLCSLHLRDTLSPAPPHSTPSPHTSHSHPTPSPPRFVVHDKTPPLAVTSPNSVHATAAYPGWEEAAPWKLDPSSQPLVFTAQTCGPLFPARCVLQRCTVVFILVPNPWSVHAAPSHPSAPTA
eukprot:354221-Chlamydomonas_euryale.AAC.1